MRRLLLPIFGAALLLCSCEGGDGANPPAVTFVFRLHHQPESEEFRYSTASPAFIAGARSQLHLPEEQRSRFPAGPLEPGDAGYNEPWSWHFVSADLVDMSMELCDGSPSLVEADLDYWLYTVKRFCPWDAYVYAEGDAPRVADGPAGEGK